MAVAYGQIRAKLSPIGSVKAVLGIGTKGGGGESSDYRDLSNKPSINGHTLIGDSNFEDIGLGTASAKNVSTSGDAGNNEVVLGNDTRLSDPRNAKDVYSWAKAENKPSYTKSEVGLGNVDNTSDATKKTNFTGSIASGNTGFIIGGDAYVALNNKVDKVDGKGLSTNDFTTELKNKLDEYPKAMSIMESIAWYEGGDIATSNWNKGEFMMWKGDLVVVTANIAENESIVLNTNVEWATMGDFLTALINKFNTMVPDPPASVGKFILKADRRVGGTISYAWEKDSSGDWDYSHLTYWHNNGLYNYNKDDSGTSIPVLTTSNVLRFLVCNDETYDGSPKLNSKNIWGVPIPSDVSSIKVTLATGSMIYTEVVKLHSFPDNSLLYERVYMPGWVSTPTQTIDVDQVREDAGGFTGQLYFFIEVAKTSYGTIAASEVAQYYPGIEYFKEETT